MYLFLVTENIQVIAHFITEIVNVLCMTLFYGDIPSWPINASELKVHIENALTSVSIRTCFTIYSTKWTDCMNVWYVAKWLWSMQAKLPTSFSNVIIYRSPKIIVYNEVIVICNQLHHYELPWYFYNDSSIKLKTICEYNYLPQTIG